MNNNINIAEILKDYPKGTKLYSPLFGKVTLEKVNINISVPIKVIDSLNNYNCFFLKQVFITIVQTLNAYSSLPMKCKIGLNSLERKEMYLYVKMVK